MAILAESMVEKWSWIAGIAALPLAVILWLVDRKQVISFCRRWSKIIIMAFILAIMYAIWKQGWLNWLAHPVTWPLWGLIIFCIFIVVAFFVLLFFAKLSTKQLGQSTQPNASGYPTQSNPYDYVSDEIFGVDWVWGYRGRVLADELSAFCPNKKCMNRLTRQENHERMSLHSLGLDRYVAPPISLNCTHCGFSRRFDSDWRKLQHDVFLEIERRIRTGEFQQRLMQRDKP
jgi:hypothetical protein